MNLLCHLPQNFEVNGKKLKINTGFKEWFRFLKEIKKSKTETDIIRSLKLVLKEEFDYADTKEVLTACFSFLNNAKSYANNDVVDDVNNNFTEIPYEISIDSNYIYSAFFEQYQIDLIDNNIHYYKFIALFDCLSENTLFKKIVHIRTQDIRKLDDSKLQASYIKLKQMFEIKEDFALSEEEIEEKRRLEQIKRENLIKEWSL